MRGGGITIISHKSIHYTPILMPVNSTFECISFSVSLSIFVFKIFTIYRPPS